MNSEDRKEVLSEKLQAMLDAHDGLSEFSGSHSNEISSAARFDAGQVTLDVTAPPEWGRLVDTYERAKAEYEKAVRTDERERIKDLIDSE